MFGFVTETKVWGHTTKIGHSPKSSQHSIVVQEGAYCSKHYHSHKQNGFIVLEGSLVIREWEDALDDSSMSEVTLTANGESHVVPPNRLHQFYTDEGARVIEFYLPVDGSDVDIEDITRLSKGGVDGAGE